MSVNLSEDYKRFKKEISKSSKNKVIIDSSNESFYKKSHQATYVISLFVSKLSKHEKEEHRIVFITEILSDLLTYNKLLILGFYNPAAILLRRSIENFYNHFFYYDHPVEYYHLNNGKNEYTPIDELKKYLIGLPVFIENKDDVIKEYNDLIFNEYHQLCRIVHTKGSDYMNLAKCLNELVTDFDFTDITKRTFQIQVYFIYIFYKFYRNLKFTRTEKDIIVNIIPKNKRSTFDE